MNVKFKPSKTLAEQINLKVTPQLKARYEFLSKRCKVDVAEHAREVLESVIHDIEAKVKPESLK